MSGDDFQTRYATVMHSMLKSAVAETTKLFETMVDELKAEISRIKKENEDLKTKCNEFENAKNPKTSDEKESEPEQGPSNARDKCDHGVQCDLVPMRSVLMEQFSRPHQSRNSTIQKQVQQVDDTMNVGLQKEQRSETHGKGKTSKAFVLLKQEQGSNHDNSVPRYILLKQEDEFTTVAHRHAIHEIPDLQGAFIDHNTPEEHPVNHPSSVMEFGLNCERGGQSQTPEPEQPPVVTCPATEDNVEEQCEVAKQILKTFTTSATQVELPKLDENQPLFNAEQQLMVQHLEKEQASVVNKQLHRENESLVNEETLTMQTYVDVPSTTKLSEAAELTKETSFQEVEVGLAEVEISSQPAPSTSRRRGRPPKKFCKYWPQDKMTRLSSSDVPKLQKVIPLSSSWKENDHPFLSVPSSLPKRGRPPKKHGGSELPVQDSVPPPSNKLPCVRIAISTPSMEVKDIEFSPQPCAAVFPRDGNFKDELPVKVKEGVLQSPSIQTSSATETVKALSADSIRTPPGPRRERRNSHPTLQEAMLLVEAINAQMEDKFSSPQTDSNQTQHSPPLVISKIISLASSQPAPLVSSQTPPASPIPQVPIVNNQTTISLLTGEQTATPLSSAQELPVATQTTVELLKQQSTTISQAQIKTFIIPTVSPPKQTTPSVLPSAGAIQTGMQSQQHCPRIKIVAPSKRFNYTTAPKIIVVPRPVSSRSVSSLTAHTLTALSPTQLSTVLSTVVAAKKNCLPPASTSTSLSITSPSLSTFPLKAIITPRQSLSSITSRAKCKTDQQSVTSSDPKIAILVPQQLSAMVPNQGKFTLAPQTVLLTSQKQTAEPSSTVAVSSAVSSLTSKQSNVTVATLAPTDKSGLTSSQKWDNISDILTPLQITVSEMTTLTTETCSSLKRQSSDLQTPAPPKILPVFQEKLSAVVRLIKLPLTAFAKDEMEPCLKTSLIATETFSSFNNSAVTGQAQTQVPPKLPLTTQEKTSADEKLVKLSPTSTNDTSLFSKRSTLSSKAEPMLNSAPVALHVEALILPEEPNVVNEKDSSLPNSLQPASDVCIKEITPDSKTSALSAETFIKLKESSVTRCIQKLVPTKVSTTLQEKPSLVLKLTESPAGFIDPPILETSSSCIEAGCSFEEAPCSSPVQAPLLAVINEKPAGAPLRLTSIYLKDTSSDPHLKMTKTQFLAQLAVSPVIHAPEKDISNNVDTITAGTETRNGKRLHSDSLVARLRSRLKPCLLASKTKPSKELVEEPESTPVSAKRPRFVNDFTPRKTSESVQVGTEKSKMIKGNFHPGKTTIEQIPVNAKKLRFVNVTPRCTSESLHSSKKSISVDDNPCSNKTTDEQVPISPEDHGLAKNFVNHEHKNNQSTSVIPRSRLTQDGASPKKICEEIPAYPRKCRLSKETVGFVNNISESMHGRKHRLIQEGTNHKKIKSVTNAKRVSKAAKIKTLAKIENSNQPKSKKRADASQSAKNNPSSDAQKKAKVKAIWNPPRLTASTIPLTRGRSSSLTPSKRGTRSQDQAQTPTTPQLRSQSTTPRLVITLNRAPSNPPNRSQTVGPSSKGHRSSSCTGVYPPSVSLHPIPVRAPPIISPLQPLSVIGRRLLKNQCGECGRVLSSPAALESHVQLHTGRRPFSCTLCGKCFPDSKGLSRHGRVHRNGRIHICSQCGKGFVYRFGLTKHLQMVHGRVKPFACQVCSKGFFTKRDLEAHFRIHTGEKPFHCNLCEKQFKRRVELNVHLRWHNGEKRHWCPYCGKGFLDYNNLKRHKYIHTGEKPHSCSHCSKKFTQSGHLKKHLKNVHKVK